jgi:hypothetical protein
MDQPTLTFSVTSGKVTIHVRLYGEVTAEREAEERRSAQHRAEQLS